jgi:hypothetical protein
MHMSGFGYFIILFVIALILDWFDRAIEILLMEVYLWM